MKLEVGKVYKTRTGTRVVILRKLEGPLFTCPYVGQRLDGEHAHTCSYWAEDGRCDFERCPQDLIEEVAA